jgi:hypothetical protein
MAANSRTGFTSRSANFSSSSTGSKKRSEIPIDAKRLLVEPEQKRLLIARQCELLGMSRAAYYYELWERDETALKMLRAIDEEYTRHPFLGKRRMCDYLAELGYDVGVKRVRTLMAWLGLEAIYPKKSLCVPNREHKKYPYLLKRLPIIRPNQVWASDITYVRLHCGFAYLTVVIRGVRCGRKPNEHGRKSASNKGSMTNFTAIWTTRSLTVGIPSGRVRSGWSGLGM